MGVGVTVSAVVAWLGLFMLIVNSQPPIEGF